MNTEQATYLVFGIVLVLALSFDLGLLNKKNQKISSLILNNQINNELIVQLPSEMKFKNITGDIWLYCPTDDKKDRKLKLFVDENGRQVISTKTIAAAGYLIKINWQADAQTYYNEQHIQIK